MDDGKTINSTAKVNSRIKRLGVFNYLNGDQYNGNWVDGHKEGTGIHTSKNGDTYEGHWKNDKRHGYGKLLTK